ncbi:MAG: FAD-dependent oxidoreductase [Hydrogenophilaceae bacterium]|jgi:glycine oxidase|nr:FAD-dependent oxidoreductase [Hydrogenophilaceae bacterium]
MTKRVIVVGAGIVGSFCALRLARSGARVTLIDGEAEDFSPGGPSASLAAAGLLTVVGHAPLAGGGQPALPDLAHEAFALWRDHSAGAAWEDGVRFEGGVVIAADAAAAEAFVAQARAAGRKAHRLAAAEFRKRTGLDAPVAGAVFVEEEGAADPPRVLSGMAFALHQLGVRVRRGVEVEAVEADPIRVRTFDDQRIEADVVVLATGIMNQARLARSAPALARMRPAKGHMVPVELAAPLPVPVRAGEFYLAPREGRSAVLGATMEWDRYDRGVKQEQVRALLDAAEKTLPGAVKQSESELPWAGVRPMSPDGAPMIGWSGPALIAAGHSRNGWLFAPLTAEIVCAYVWGEEIPARWAALSPDRFKD